MIINVLTDGSPFIIVAAFVALLLFMMTKSHQDASVSARRRRKAARQSDVDKLMGNRNNGTPGLDIVGSLRDAKIVYKGVINIDGQRI